jgi:hypothetical protein
MRPKTPLAVENSVGKPAANAAPNAGPGSIQAQAPTDRYHKDGDVKIATLAREQTAT